MADTYEQLLADTQDYIRVRTGKNWVLTGEPYNKSFGWVMSINGEWRKTGLFTVAPETISPSAWADSLMGRKHGA